MGVGGGIVGGGIVGAGMVPAVGVWASVGEELYARMSRRMATTIKRIVTGGMLFFLLCSFFLSFRFPLMFFFSP